MSLIRQYYIDTIISLNAHRDPTLLRALSPSHRGAKPEAHRSNISYPSHPVTKPGIHPRSVCPAAGRKCWSISTVLFLIQLEKSSPKLAIIMGTELNLSLISTNIERLTKPLFLAPDPAVTMAKTSAMSYPGQKPKGFHPPRLRGCAEVPLMIWPPNAEHLQVTLDYMSCPLKLLISRRALSGFMGRRLVLIYPSFFLYLLTFSHFFSSCLSSSTASLPKPNLKGT